MKTALFTNFSNEPFTGYWNGKGKTFAPGQAVYMPDYLAKHFAKHLTNRELLKLGKETDTSPKAKMRPDGTEYIENVNFMELFNKAYQPDDEDPLSDEKDSVDVQIEVANKNRDARKAAAPAVAIEPEPSEPQVDVTPEDDDDNFGGTPVEESV